VAKVGEPFQTHSVALTALRVRLSRKREYPLSVLSPDDSPAFLTLGLDHKQKMSPVGDERNAFRSRRSIGLPGSFVPDGTMLCGWPNPSVKNAGLFSKRRSAKQYSPKPRHGSFSLGEKVRMRAIFRRWLGEFMRTRRWRYTDTTETWFLLLGREG
jgi:hypothetical protein